MSVPLDRLYDFLCDLVNRDVIIYRWMPHGSKNLKDLKQLSVLECPKAWLTTPLLFCHDQEPLNYRLYSTLDCQNAIESVGDSARAAIMQHPQAFDELYTTDIRTVAWENLFDFSLLTHSELRSQDVMLYEQAGFVPIYFWSHGLIARDWFRYAEHDPILKKHHVKDIKHDFLIYNRAWSGTREYRLKFMESLITHQLVDNCLTSFACCDSGVDYRSHSFTNKNFSLQRSDLEMFFRPNHYSSCSSADYSTVDYSTCGIEVVLETMFDDMRWHLTEKTLRPIACGMPFILASTANSLEYLRLYGFKTFSGLLDETYDTIVDPVLRLNAIINEMSRIAKLPVADKQRLWEQLLEIAKFNQLRFFSSAFQDQIVSEFKHGFSLANKKVQSGPKGNKWAAFYNFTSKYFPDLVDDVFTVPDEYNWTLEWLKQRR